MRPECAVTKLQCPVVVPHLMVLVKQSENQAAAPFCGIRRDKAVEYNFVFLNCCRSPVLIENVQVAFVLYIKPVVMYTVFVFNGLF